MAGMDKIGKSSAKKTTQGSSDRLAVFGRKRQGVDFDWRCLGNPLFGAAMGALASAGAAIMVGGAAGGRGAVISIYLDGDKHRTFLEDPEQFAEWCHDVLETFTEGAEDRYAAYNLKRRGE